MLYQNPVHHRHTCFSIYSCSACKHTDFTADNRPEICENHFHTPIFPFSTSINGFILDGFPRTIVQARELESIEKEFDFTIDAIINLDIPQDKLVKRLSGRRTCKECGATFHVEFNPPKVEGVCDKCGGELYQREDESEEAVTIRLDTYNKQTKPLIDYYTMKGTIININGDQPMEDVFKSIEKSLEGK